MKYRKGYKYQVAHAETYDTCIYPPIALETKFLLLFPSGKMVIRAGYAWDGASGPTWDSKSSMRGSLFHDAIYQLIRQRKLDPKWRVPADVELGRLLREDGMWKWRRRAWVNALVAIAAYAADPKNAKKIYTAP